MTPTDVVQLVAMLLVAGFGLAVVVTREPVHQAMVFALSGGALALLFLAVQAPDVALSEIVVGAVAWPAMGGAAPVASHRRRRLPRHRGGAHEAYRGDTIILHAVVFDMQVDPRSQLYLGALKLLLIKEFPAA